MGQCCSDGICGPCNGFLIFLVFSIRMMHVTETHKCIHYISMALVLLKTSIIYDIRFDINIRTRAVWRGMATGNGSFHLYDFLTMNSTSLSST